jgi:hypothetical protein
VRNGKKILGYNFSDEQQAQDGFRDVIRPIFDNDLQRLGGLIKDGNNFTYEVIDLTEQELDARIPKEVKTLDFQLALLDFGITDADVMQTINLAHQNNLITDIQKEGLILKWNKSSVIERSNDELFALIPLLNQVKGSQVITQDDIINIFKTKG